MLAENIKRYRAGRGLTQEDLARAAGITHSALSKIEVGYSRDPRVMTVQKIAQALGVTVDDLLRNEEE